MKKTTVIYSRVIGYDLTGRKQTNEQKKKAAKKAINALRYGA